MSLAGKEHPEVFEELRTVLLDWPVTGDGTPAPTTDLSDQELERLRGLGYVN